MPFAFGSCACLSYSLSVCSCDGLIFAGLISSVCMLENIVILLA